VAQMCSGSLFLAGRRSEWRPTGVVHSVLRAPSLALGSCDDACRECTCRLMKTEPG
jgi:hypothetical protein